MRKRWTGSLMLFAALLAAFTACGSPGNGAGGDELSFNYDFSESAHGWTGGFSDLPADYDAELYDLRFEHTERPEEVGEVPALMISGRNASDDLFMFVKKGLTADDGIAADTTYRITFEVAFATDAPAGAVGIGGPPGEAVWVKVGAAPKEPAPVEEEEGGRPFLAMNVAKGRQNNDGEHAIRIGNVAKEESEEFEVYELKTLDNADNPLEMTSDGEGNLWIFVGTDSGFEGRTTLYYTDITVELVPVE